MFYESLSDMFEACMYIHTAHTRYKKENEKIK